MAPASPWRSIAYTLLLATLAGPARPQTPELVKDLNTNPVFGSEGSGTPRDLLPVGSRLFFSLAETSSGRELWTTDGTAVGTELLADACPGSCNANPQVLGTIAGTVLFSAAPDAVLSSPVLWRSDGTRAGTYPLSVSGLPLVVGPSALFHGRLYFSGCRPGSLECQLWQTDGTLAGTRSVFDPAGHGAAGEMVAAADRLYFVTGGHSLWALDDKGVSLLLPDRPAELGHLRVSGSELFFAGAVVEGGELWASDGTAAGTRLLTGTTSLPFAGPPLAAGAGRAYFAGPVGTARSGLWTTDGTATGTREVARVPLADPITLAGAPPVVVLGGRLVFLTGGFSLGPLTLWGADAAGNPDSATQISTVPIEAKHSLVQVGARVLFVAGGKIWSTDGTYAGTGSITGPCACGATVRGPRALGDTAYFASLNGSRYDLWQTDGTAASTRRAVSPGSWSAGDLFDSLEVGTLGGRLYFNAVNPEGSELWSAAPGGAAEIVAGGATGGPSSSPTSLTAVGDHLIFNANPDVSPVLWGSAGSAESTVSLGSDPAQVLGRVGSLAFFTVSGFPQKLFRTDGTPAGTFQVAQFDLSRFLFAGQAVVGGRFFFAAGTNDQSEVWASDGTPAGTAKAFELPDPGQRIGWLGASATQLFVGAVDSAGSGHLWASDGTLAGTHPVGDFGADGVIHDASFFSVGSSVLFFVSTGSLQAKLWASDGTAAGTGRLATGFPSFAPVAGPARLGGVAYVFIGRELWRTDGSPAGTALVRSFPYRVAPPPSYLTAFAGRLYFVAPDDSSGTELWTSDGTAEGTVLLKDIRPGLGSSDPAWLQVGGNRLYFAADDGVHGRELWASDGTAEGTRLWSDLAPEALSSDPAELTVAGGRLYFSADDGLSGRELWALPLDGAGCQAGGSRLCLVSGRFQVEVEWKDFQGRTGIGHAVPLTADSGSFWFFDAANLELIVKVLDARSLNGEFWVFYGALSNVEYSITVTDTQTGLTRRYFNSSGRFASVGDTRGFGALGAFSRRRGGIPAPVAADRGRPASAATGCEESLTRLCLQGGRFAVDADWQDFQGRTGRGMAVPLSGDTGTFWFFGPENLEVVVKVLDGRGLNGKFWFFYGALSNVAYTLTVTDTATGQVRTYKNPSGQFASRGDTAAF